MTYIKMKMDSAHLWVRGVCIGRDAEEGLVISRHV